MSSEPRNTGKQFQPIEDEALINALNELGRSINIATTYGHQHPAVEAAVVTAEVALNTLFSQRKKVIIGVFNSFLTIDGVPVRANGTLLKSLERRLDKFCVTGLKISRGITRNELTELVHLFSKRETGEFQKRMDSANLSHITSENTTFKAVHEGEHVVHEADLGNMGGHGVHQLDDGSFSIEETNAAAAESSIHVDQIVAFLQGDVDMSENGNVAEGLSELASDPEKLGRIIMESVSIRQKVTDLNGESLGDIILGSLRRTYDGLHNQNTFQNPDGKADLRKSMLLLEKNLLERMRDLGGKANPELDRQIVQAIQEMDEELGFEMAALQYMEYRDAIEERKIELQEYIKSHGAEVAEELIADTDFPSSEWRRLVMGSEKETHHLVDGLSTLTTVFERLEKMMKSKDADGSSVKDLLGQATENLDDTLFTTKEKLDVLSQQLKDGETGTIGGHGRNMTQDELLAALAEVAQELMQPLTAITASMEMMLGGFVGEITLDQRDLLDLAANSGEHLKYLMKELINIVGCPANKGVDSRFHTTSDQVVQLRDAEGQEHLPLNYFQ